MGIEEKRAGRQRRRSERKRTKARIRPAPLLVLSDAEAVENRKKNPYVTWGERGNANRVEPIAQPAFDVPYKLQREEKIFTIGSCFARNIEGELAHRGFRNPMRELFSWPEMKSAPLEIVNNFGTPSIYNEIAWAFAEESYEPEKHILEVLPGKFADIHLSPALRPEPWDVVLGRRLAISRAYRLVTTCSTVIMTLGLAELWFDTHTSFYLNVAPRPSHIAAYPGRFEMHVLSFESAYDYLERAILILKRYAPEIRILLTVSPIPMILTHRAMDVMVANTYSKSLLRTVAEAIVAKYDFITYYPSYESIVLSDRQLTWMEDLVHVKPEIIALNVGRMIEAYMEIGDAEDEISDAITAQTRAKRIRERGPEVSAAFFGRHAAWSDKSREFALEHARFLIDVKRGAEALQIVSQYQPDDLTMAGVTAKALVAVGRAREAHELLNPFCTPRNRSPELWETFLAAAMATESPDVVNATYSRFLAAVGFRGPASVIVAKWFLARGEKERALVYASRGIDENLPFKLRLDLADLLFELGDIRRAGAALDRIEAPPKFLLPRIERLRSLLVASDPQ